jgi:hypothetical protein
MLLLGGCSDGNSQTEKPPPAGKAAAKTAAVNVSRDNPCSVMFPTEVGEILGTPSEMREIMDAETCRFHFEPATERQPKPTRDETFIEVKVHWTDGRTAVGAGAAGSGSEKVTAIGDEAWWKPQISYLAFIKGDSSVEIDMQMMPGEKEKAVRLAQLIASRL